MTNPDTANADRWVCRECEQPLDVDAVAGNVAPCDTCLTDALDGYAERYPYRKCPPQRQATRDRMPAIRLTALQVLMLTGASFDGYTAWIREIRAAREAVKA